MKIEMADFNLSAEIRTSVQANPSLKNREIIEIVQKKFPKQTINFKTAMVSVSVSRKKLGLRKTAKRVVKQKRTTLKPTTMVGTKVSGNSAGMATLSAAKTLLEECEGDEALAVQAIRELASLQLG
ncbi:MAG: hypothetical protein ABJZ55_13125 [Fuerstiella sp.]